MNTRQSLGILMIAAVLLAAAPAVGLADEQLQASNPDAKCVKCHSRGLKKKLEDGETMSLKIDVDVFETSVHRVIGCTGCHRDVAKGKHPSRQPIASARAYSLKQSGPFDIDGYSVTFVVAVPNGTASCRRTEFDGPDEVIECLQVIFRCSMFAMPVRFAHQS